MVFAFSEEEKKQIESCGCFVVEFKMVLKRVKKAYENILECIEQIKKAAYKVGKIVRNFLDDLSFVIENINHNLNMKTSFRYKMVYVISKCTGIERKCVWKMIRPAYLARSRC